MKNFALALAHLVIAGSLAGAALAQTQWDLPTNYAEGAFHTKNIVQFAAEVEKATGGSLKIAVHPGGTMIKHAEIKRAVGEGKVAAGEILISLAADEAPVYGVDSIPFLATGYDGARKLYEAQKAYLEKQLAKEGLILLFSVPWPPQGIYAKREFKSVEEIKGLKFRTYNVMTKRIAELALRYRIPSVCTFRDFAYDGGLMSYFADEAEMYRSAAVLVDKVLKGAKAAELPVEQTTDSSL